MPVALAVAEAVSCVLLPWQRVWFPMSARVTLGLRVVTEKPLLSEAGQEVLPEVCEAETVTE